MLRNIFNQDNQSDYRTVHPVLAQLVKQMLTPQPARTMSQSGPQRHEIQMPQQKVGVMQQPQQGGQQSGLLNSLGGLIDNISLFNKINEGGNTIFPSSSGIDNSWWNSGVDYQPGGYGYQNVYNGPFSNLFG